MTSTGAYKNTPKTKATKTHLPENTIAIIDLLRAFFRYQFCDTTGEGNKEVEQKKENVTNRIF
ncbi:MAG: hypothetical protein JWR23_291 [Mucilaginibacter sp.]|nr:hypothetical protein [Mucilaginibacter sp.]